jgi:diaminohydroxyphosphoribosylaminopyrimidine deaminase/5-amino-6-(5-phosphoribosylamino)uracil reductase
MFATVDEAPVLVVGAEDRIAGPLPPGVSHLAATSLGDALAGLARAGLDALLVEGGGRLAGSLLREGLVDRIYQIQAPVWLGTGHPAWAHLPEHTLPTAPRWHTILRRRLGDDTLLVLEP